MAQNFFYRNVRARDYLEIFLVSAVTSLLLLRFFLHLSGYPQVGGAHLHIAHMLYGGLLMAAAIVLSVSFLGSRILRLSALVGGVGFGIFIDELGKFITKDNNYFFRPAVGLIYAVFIILYLVFSFLGRQQRLSSREYELNALAQFEEVVLHNLDNTEKSAIRHLLARADQNSPLVKELQALLAHIEVLPPARPNRLRRLLQGASRRYQHFWQARRSSRLIGALFILEAGLFFAAVAWNFIHDFDSLQAVLRTPDTYAHRLMIGEVTSAAVAAIFAVYGAYRLKTSRYRAYELFARATLINLFLTEFFLFARLQFRALPGFLLNLLLLLAVRYAMHEEREQLGRAAISSRD